MVAQHHDRRGRAGRVAERAGEAEQPADLGPPERVDRLVRVADRDEGRGRADEPLQQPQLRRVGVLQLVDEDERVRATQLRLHRWVVGEQRCAVDHLGVVAHALEVEHLEVLGKELTDRAPGRPEVTAAGADALQVLGVQAERAGPGQHRAHLRGQPAGAEGGGEVVGPVQPAVADGVGEQLAQPLLLLRSRQQAQRLAEVLRRLCASHQRVGEGVEGGHGRHEAGADPGRDPLPPVLRGLAPEGEPEHPVRSQRVGARQPRDHGLHEGRRLAGPRPGEHQQRPAAVVDDPQLVGVQLRRRRRQRHRAVEHEPRRLPAAPVTVTAPIPSRP